MSGKRALKDSRLKASSFNTACTPPGLSISLGVIILMNSSNTCISSARAFSPHTLQRASDMTSRSECDWRATLSISSNSLKTPSLIRTWSLSIWLIRTPLAILLLARSSSAFIPNLAARALTRATFAASADSSVGVSTSVLLRPINVICSSSRS